MRVTSRKLFPFFLTGGTWSIPALFGEKSEWFSCFLRQSLRMTYGLMAFFANANQVSLLVAVLIGKESAQCQIRPALHMIHMMHHVSPAVFSSGLAQLALMPIIPENICTQAPPLWCNVEWMHIT